MVYGTGRLIFVKDEKMKLEIPLKVLQRIVIEAAQRGDISGAIDTIRFYKRGCRHIRMIEFEVLARNVNEIKQRQADRNTGMTRIRDRLTRLKG